MIVSNVDQCFPWQAAVVDEFFREHKRTGTGFAVGIVGFRRGLLFGLTLRELCLVTSPRDDQLACDDRIA